MSALSAEERRRIRRLVPPNKRKRTAFSCDWCKKRRVKCTRHDQSEVCEHCVTYNQNCQTTIHRKNGHMPSVPAGTAAYESTVIRSPLETGDLYLESQETGSREELLQQIEILRKQNCEAEAQQDFYRNELSRCQMQLATGRPQHAQESDTLRLASLTGLEGGITQTTARLDHQAAVDWTAAGTDGAWFPSVNRTDGLVNLPHTALEGGPARLADQFERQGHHLQEQINSARNLSMSLSDTATSSPVSSELQKQHFSSTKRKDGGSHIKTKEQLKLLGTRLNSPSTTLVFGDEMFETITGLQMLTGSRRDEDCSKDSCITM
ncbi:Zn(2)-C6 fungal-type DNA-binding domain protein [Niveomyces insectorum RCEF 264]|uniref:Zn(2)-C6 fungal-type DNA-binding domain protein n=1 Tax=Niveomyces insectorum RCEF 264 TaxID=1081102 RepID=A0A167W3A9_9HYPO|nr:Zn(2)-C6 fungal-type DNA-binding domain protein [Niveomyces insectorum RCEF 264]